MCCQKHQSRTISAFLRQAKYHYMTTVIGSLKLLNKLPINRTANLQYANQSLQIQIVIGLKKGWYCKVVGHTRFICILIRAARQSQIFSAGGDFDVFGYAKHENQNKKNLKNREQLVQGPQSGKNSKISENVIFSLFSQ